jgi:N-succinyldiaminopimelate aminotransferase
VDAPESFESGKEFSDFLLEKVGLAVLPAAPLYHDQQLGRRKLRIAFCKREATLQEVRRRLEKMNEKLKRKAPAKGRH